MSLQPALTKHQREVLKSLIRRSGQGRWWIDRKDSGAPAALEHLFEKGYVLRRISYGPRGGQIFEYMPSMAGFHRVGASPHPKVAAS